MATQASSLTLIGQMSPQGISTMFHMRMIERRRGFDPPQHHLIQSAEQKDPEDITNNVPPQHEDPPSQPPPIHRPVHAAVSLSYISERLTRFEQVSDFIAVIKSSKAHYYLGNCNSTGKRFSTTAMSYSNTTIATTRYNILLAQDLWTNEPLPPPEYPLPLSSSPWPIILHNSNSRNSSTNSGSFTSLSLSYI
ncbi:hypothetical protein GOBAR_AA20963 [Gossypium barbadense]|uniref:Uncharacterized protein n=1 Tax=Gossypium barbadense TaxID=3634 RepID=A0A2P5X8P5_GOSBA|nr:hypothetical protein GOBAR_AA20963 [Gossypium barbadense]